MLARRKQVFACLKELKVCQKDALKQIAALLDLQKVYHNSESIA